MNNKFYVYEWFNIETNEVFYVGKGCGKRAYETHRRNKKFLNYIENNRVNVRIIKDNLSEEDAFKLEKITIEKYKEQQMCSANITSGGYGGCNFVWTNEMREYKSKYNPMKDEKQRERMQKNNPMADKEIAAKQHECLKRAVVINGIEYPSVIEAASSLGVVGPTITRWCQQGYNTKGLCRYADQEQKEVTTPTRGKKVIIDETTIYNSAIDAAKALGANDSSPLCKAIKLNKPYKGHICRYVNQQPSQ